MVKLKPRYQKIEVQMWNDEKFVPLSAAEKYLFLYLLTSPHSNCLGAFVLKPGYAADDLGWEREQYLETLNSLSAKGFVTVDLTLYLTVVNNYLKHNPPDNQNQFKAILNMLVSLPQSPLLNTSIAYLQGFAERFSLPLPEQFSKPFAKPVTVTVTVAVTEKPSLSSSSSVKVIEKEAKDVVEEKPKTENREPMKMSEAQNLYVRYFGRMNTNQGIGSVLQDICREYPPEQIREAFQAAGAAQAKTLLWIINRLKGLENADVQARASPQYKTFAQMSNDNSKQACRDFVEGDDG